MERFLWLSTHILKLNWALKFNRIFPIVKFRIFVFCDINSISFFILLMTHFCCTLCGFLRRFTLWRRLLSLLLFSLRNIFLIGSIMRGDKLRCNPFWIFKIWYCFSWISLSRLIDCIGRLHFVFHNQSCSSYSILCFNFSLCWIVIIITDGFLIIRTCLSFDQLFFKSL